MLIYYFGNFKWKRNEIILEEMKVELMDENLNLQRYKSNWLQHATRITTTECQKYCQIIEQIDDDWEEL
jgi:hypothetical protein